MADYTSRSGVRVAAEFRDNLIIDRHDPVFASMRASKRRHLRGAGSEDAVAWNVFRSLRQIAPAVWLNDLFTAAFPRHTLSHTEHATVELWKTVEPPPALVIEADEGEMEIDVVIGTPSAVWCIEAKRATREQVLRSIDVASYHAGTRHCFFSLLVIDAARAKEAVAAVDGWKDLAKPRELLASHRPDKLANLAGISRLTTADLGEVLSDAATDAGREDERQYAERALQWLRGRGLAKGGG
jgi:hypothetical protein